MTLGTSCFSAVAVRASIHMGISLSAVIVQESGRMGHLDATMTIIAEALLMTGVASVEHHCIGNVCNGKTLLVMAGMPMIVRPVFCGLLFTFSSTLIFL